MSDMNPIMRVVGDEPVALFGQTQTLEDADRKKKFETMCRAIFPEYKLQWFENQIKENPSKEIFFLQQEFDLKYPLYKIHWYQCTMNFIAPALFKLNKDLPDARLLWQFYDFTTEVLRNKKHPIDLLYERFEKIYIFG